MIQPSTILADAFQKKNIHFFVILACLLMQMFNLGFAYRFFAYTNFLIVLIYFFNQFKVSHKFKNTRWLQYLVLFPLGFFALHFVAVQNLIIIKEMRHILLAVFLAIGVVALVKTNDDYIRKNIFRLSSLIVFAYVIVQATSIWIFDEPYGTTRNPHYLALYSSACIIVAIYCFLNASEKLKLGLSVCIVMLSIFLIHTSSRPVWVSLSLTSILIIFFLNKKSRIYAALVMTITILALVLTNAGNFFERSQDLITNVATEERVTIWQDTWRMQADSSVKAWIVGHGLDAFEEDFKLYSKYHLKNIDFNSPHNYFLELLYISGIFGICLALSMFWIVYKNIIFQIKNYSEHRNVYLILLAVLTSSIIFASITLPFFTSYTINILALVIGTLIYLRKSNQQLHYE